MMIMRLAHHVRARSAAAGTAAAFTSSSSSLAPFRVLGLQQIAIGALDKGPLAQLWTGLLGVPKVGSYQSEKENVDEDILITGHGPYAVEIDLMQPIDPTKAPKVHVPALNHVGLWVDDLDAAVASLTEQGVRFAPGGIRAGASGHNVAFIHPKGNEATPYSGEGVLLELVQAPPDVIAAHPVEK
jgi:lactoylglutathione lyase